MLHFPSSLQNGGGSSGIPRRTDSLNATQQKTPSHQIFLTIEQELHDARRVGTHGQEDDLRSALNMVINRVTELSSMLSEAYKSKAELEVQLNVAKSNLQLVIANNEMLEEALKSGNGRDVGWRRASTSTTTTTERPVSVDSHSPSSANANESPTEGAGSNSRFFKTFFSNSSNGTRPGTPTLAHQQPQPQPQSHFTSPSMPSLHGHAHEDDALQALRASAEKARQDAERERQLAIRERKAADKARADAAAAARDKIALEAEIESLSQALFEEANKMVASERMRRAEVEGELEKLRPLAEELKKTKTELREDREELREAREGEGGAEERTEAD
ncbi:Sec2p domain-containing protein [Mycena venus]|uniref:Sec2p domain-containing protein n=1 Tax=Mycena venus TaxID=2733690 RepID=A0A8H6YHJ4_9AGAR|nr:Sec2p domain-containing protein [Mycena venus]